MPIQIIRQDITKITCDAIVNPSNRYLEPSGGTDLAIHEAAGPQLYEYTQKLGGCSVGSAKISPAFNLNCKYVIHTAGPNWYLEERPKELLISCYKECLKLAIEYQCESLALPLISSGTYGCPKDQALKIAFSTISEFLFQHEILVYLVLFDREAYDLGKKLFADIAAYIDDRYVWNHTDNLADLDYLQSCQNSDVLSVELQVAAQQNLPCKCSATTASKPSHVLEDYIRPGKKFAYKLVELIQEKGMSNVECYKRANVSKQTWHNIETNLQYNPQKNTVISFAVALKLTIEEAQQLLNTVGLDRKSVV